MSEENVEIVRAYVEAFNARNMEALLELCDPEVEVDWSRSRGLEARIYRGREAVRSFLNTFFQTFDRVTVSPDEFIECGEHVVVPNRAHFWGRDGVKVEARSVLVWTFARDASLNTGSTRSEPKLSKPSACRSKTLTPPEPARYCASDVAGNVKLVRSIFAAWERGDFSSAEWAHHEIEFVIADGPSPGGWTGGRRDGRGARSILSAWEEFRQGAEEYRELDGERVLVLTHRSGRGKTSGVAFAQMRLKGAGLFHVRDGKVTGKRRFERDTARAMSRRDLERRENS